MVAPVPQDLCGHKDEKKIRKIYQEARAQDSGIKLAKGQSEDGLVPCEHGKLRFLYPVIAKKKTLVIVEEDRRPSYLSGGSHRFAYAVVDGQLLHSSEEIWKKLSPDKLSQQEISHLLVAALMFSAQPNMVVNEQQRNDLKKAWPAVTRALQLDPPGIYRDFKGLYVLQAWTHHSYSERGVSCQYLDGWQIRFEPKTGVKMVQNHAYAEGQEMGDPCGKPLP